MNCEDAEGSGLIYVLIISDKIPGITEENNENLIRTSA
jgi:hypothetical protein